MKFLEEQFARDPTWSRKTVQICKKALKLKTDQIYKWGYDRKKRIKKQTENNEVFLPQDQNRNIISKTISNEHIDISTLIPLPLNKTAKRFIREAQKKEAKENKSKTVGIS